MRGVPRSTRDPGARQPRSPHGELERQVDVLAKLVRVCAWRVGVELPRPVLPRAAASRSGRAGELLRRLKRPPQSAGGVAFSSSACLRSVSAPPGRRPSISSGGRRAACRSSAAVAPRTGDLALVQDPVGRGACVAPGGRAAEVEPGGEQVPGASRRTSRCTPSRTSWPGCTPGLPATRAASAETDATTRASSSAGRPWCVEQLHVAQPDRRPTRRTDLDAADAQMTWSDDRLRARSADASFRCAAESPSAGPARPKITANAPASNPTDLFSAVRPRFADGLAEPAGGREVGHAGLSPPRNDAVTHALASDSVAPALRGGSATAGSCSGAPPPLRAELPTPPPGRPAWRPSVPDRRALCAGGRTSAARRVARHPCLSGWPR